MLIARRNIPIPPGINVNNNICVDFVNKDYVKTIS